MFVESCITEQAGSKGSPRVELFAAGGFLFLMGRAALWNYPYTYIIRAQREWEYYIFKQCIFVKEKK